MSKGNPLSCLQACEPGFPQIHYPQTIRTCLEFKSLFIECSFTPLHLKWAPHSCHFLLWALALTMCVIKISTKHPTEWPVTPLVFNTHSQTWRLIDSAMVQWRYNYFAAYYLHRCTLHHSYCQACLSSFVKAYCVNSRYIALLCCIWKSPANDCTVLLLCANYLKWVSSLLYIIFLKVPRVTANRL